jgi:hypothetical protein
MAAHLHGVAIQHVQQNHCPDCTFSKYHKNSCPYTMDYGLKTISRPVFDEIKKI